MTDQTRDKASRYDQLGPVARALVDDYDALDLAEMLVKAQDQLAALRQVARGYCPACGRGDAAPTVDNWEQQRQRADHLAGLLAEVLGQFQPLRPEHNPTGEPTHWQARVLPYEIDAWQKAAAGTAATSSPEQP